MTCTRFCRYLVLFVVLLVDHNVHSFRLYGLFTMLSTEPAHCGVLPLQTAYLSVTLQLCGGFKGKNH